MAQTDPVLQRVFEEIRELGRELRDDRRHADSAAAAERRQAVEATGRSDERFDRQLREFREDSRRNVAETQRAWRDLRTVGLSIVRTLNRHTRLLDGIDRKLGVRRNGHPGNGRHT